MEKRILNNGGYQTVLIEDITTENVTEKINTKLLEMEKQSYKLVTMSFLGTEKAVLVFKKRIKRQFAVMF